MDAWTDAMRRGDFAAAWRISDAVLRARTQDFTLPRHLQLIWNGAPLDGKRVLVHCYHGLGDTLQFVRLLPALRARAREVILWAQPALLELLHGIDGCDHLAALHDGIPHIARDADIELMELPHILRLGVDSIPARVPYLRVSTPVRARTSEKHVGIVWRAGEWDRARSIPARLLAPLSRLPNIRWHSLQYPAGTPPFRMHNLACTNLAEQARRLHALDLVVSVDTCMAHLAGALGLPVWLLLPAPCDWRWMEARDDTPWYPTMRLLRQPRGGDWKDVIDHLGAELRAWAAADAQRCAA